MTPPSQPNETGDALLRNGSQTKRTKKNKLNGIKKKNDKAQIVTPRKSLIRKRPVSFGNPALGTYHGCVYTLDVIGEDYSPINRPIIEGAESVERVVAMVDVPPDQVPEGILNLVRPHRPYLYHIRIVIDENNEEFQVEPNDKGSEERTFNLRLGQEETKDELPSFHSTSSLLPSQSTSHAVTAMENAASIMAADEEKHLASNVDSIVKDMSDDNKGNTNDALENTLFNDSEEDEAFKDSSRTYLVLLELCSVDAVEDFVEDLHGKPYTSLDPSQTCSVHQVLALTGENGVALLSPIFAPTAKTTSPKGSVPSATPAATMPPNGSSVSASGATSIAGAIAPSIPTLEQAASPSKTTHSPIVEDYNCAVCLEHMVLSETEHDDNDASKRSSILTTVCNHSFHMDCLIKWQDSPCPVCRYDHSGLNEALSQCHMCGRTENNYVCLICGVISCGGPPLQQHTGSASGTAGTDRMQSESPVCGARRRTTTTTPSHSGDNGRTANNTLPPMENSRHLSQSHARKHYDETLHAYALDTETQHVWDFAGQGYVHRLLQNKEDGKLVEFHDPSNTSSNERSLTPGLSDAQEGEVLHRKLEGFASQYYTLLKSQLEQQRIYYEGRLGELRRESFVKKKAQTSDLINALKQEKAQLSKRVVSLKARQCKVVEDTAFLKNMNESLEANKEPLRHKIKEAQRQRIEAKEHIQHCLPVLEEKATALLQELTGETHVEHDNDKGDGLAAECEKKMAPPESSAQGDDRKPAAQR